MKKKDPAFWAAIRLQRILGQIRRRDQPDSLPLLSNLLHEQKSVERGWRLYQKAKARGWMLTANILLTRLDADIASVHAASRAARVPPRHIPVPTVSDIRAELDQLEDEFGGVQISCREKHIDVTTDPVTLQDIHLGPFSIQLCFENLAKRTDASAFVIVARDANPAASDCSCTHPHVRDEHLCAGDAAMPIAHALSEGRFGDAFQLINRVLHTYNPGSPFVDLDVWDGAACRDCGNTMPGDSRSCCDHCGGDYCDDCTRRCETCDAVICVGCADTDENGTRLCPKCKEDADQESEETYEAEEEQTPVSDDSIYVSQPVDPQTQTENADEPSPQIPVPAHAQDAQLPGGAADGGGKAGAADLPAAA